ncbi:MAG TPA: hypothetical protein VLG25_01420 [Patescibacteria group bacterium]|nr:hypothetical protein [Patescibacteria group bacterium]
MTEDGMEEPHERIPDIDLTAKLDETEFQYFDRLSNEALDENRNPTAYAVGNITSRQDALRWMIGKVNAIQREAGEHRLNLDKLFDQVQQEVDYEIGQLSHGPQTKAEHLRLSRIWNHPNPNESTTDSVAS